MKQLASTVIQSLTVLMLLLSPLACGDDEVDPGTGGSSDDGGDATGDAEADAGADDTTSSDSGSADTQEQDDAIGSDVAVSDGDDGDTASEDAGDDAVNADVTQEDAETDTPSDTGTDDTSSEDTTADASSDDVEPDTALDTTTVDLGDVVFELAWYVDPAAGDGGSGERWETAFNSIDDAMAEEEVRDIFVKTGTFTPGTAEAVVLTLAEGAQVYGGFPEALTGRSGSIDERSEEDWTILDGAFDDAEANNSLHVVMGAAGTRLDGFVIRNGRADSTEVNADRRGAGLYMRDSDGMTIANVIFSANEAFPGVAAAPDRTQGGGLYCRSSIDILLENVEFLGNQAIGAAGRLDGEPGDSTVVEPGRGQGGGAYLTGCDGEIRDSLFDGNVAVGGDAADGITTFVNPGDGAIGEGGGLFLNNSEVVGTSVTFSENEAVGGVGADGASCCGDGKRGHEGGDGRGGGAVVARVQVELTWTDITFSENVATGGQGGHGGDGVQTGSATCYEGGRGGHGGDAWGGGVFLEDTTKVIFATGLFSTNVAAGGEGGIGGADTKGVAPPEGTCEDLGATGDTGGASGGGGYSAGSGLGLGESDVLVFTDNEPSDFAGGS